MDQDNVSRTKKHARDERYREKNRAAIASKMKDWQEEHKEALAEYHREYYRDNKDKWVDQEKNRKRKRTELSPEELEKLRSREREGNRRYQERHREEINKRARDRRQANLEEVRKKAREYAAKRAGNNLDRETSRWLKLKRAFGLTKDGYNALFDSQNGVCNICHQPERATRKGRVKALAVDHDHETGKIRGLLCQNCNMMIGVSGDNEEVLAEAIIYLRRFK